MDYSITDLMKAASMMSKKYFGRQDEYTISFTKEDDGCWYVVPRLAFRSSQPDDGKEPMICASFFTTGRIQKARYA